MSIGSRVTPPSLAEILAAEAFTALDENMVEPILDHVRATQRRQLREALIAKIAERLAPILKSEGL